MAVRYVLGIDVGTTALKAVALDRERGVVAQVERDHELLSAHPGWAEEDPEQWWTTTRDAIRTLITTIPAEEIAAIGVSGMVPAMVLLDASGQPLRPSIQQNDARSIVEVKELQAAVDLREFFTITGGMPNQQNIDPRWRWLRQHEPDIVARTAYLCGSYDFIVYRLTGQLSLEENWAAESGLYDIRQHRWHTSYLEHAGIDAAILPPVRQPTEIVGGINEAVAAQTGLRVGTPVVAGSADHVAAGLASGLVQNGDVLLKFGGAGDLLYCADLPEPDPHFYFDYHDIPGLTLISGCMATSGSLVKWFAHELAAGVSLADLDAEAEQVPPGAGGIIALPYFLGEKTPIFDPSARGVFAGVMLHHTRAHLYRAILESVCYGFAHHLLLLREANRPIRRICAADGGSRSRLWMQIAADVVDHPLQVIAGEAASALGAAYVAAMGIGMFTDWHEITRFITAGPIYQPQKEHVAYYQKGFALYRDLYRRLQSFLPELGELERN
ncbi:MAG TPA: carbohydrate kinase [Ktedonobacter sp.]|nr:carbohydrate kinase [Ktedonobacter sp.]